MDNGFIIYIILFFIGLIAATNKDKKRKPKITASNNNDIIDNDDIDDIRALLIDQDIKEAANLVDESVNSYGFQEPINQQQTTTRVKPEPKQPQQFEEGQKSIVRDDIVENEVDENTEEFEFDAKKAIIYSTIMEQRF